MPDRAEAIYQHSQRLHDAVVDVPGFMGVTRTMVDHVLSTALQLGWTITPPQPKYRAVRRPSSVGIDFYEVVDRDGGTVALFNTSGTDASGTNRIRAQAYAEHLNDTHARMDAHQHDES